MHFSSVEENSAVPESVLEAIKLGMWDFEPEPTDQNEFDATVAMPGTTEKITVLADRVSRGLPLWHNNDRDSYDESELRFKEM